MGISEEGARKPRTIKPTPGRCRRSSSGEGKRQPFKLHFCVSLCDLHSLVIHKAGMLALSQERLLPSAPHLAATGHIQIRLGLKSREKTGALLHFNGGYLPLLLLPREEPLKSPPLLILYFPLVILKWDMPGPGCCWFWAPLEKLDRS